MEDDLIYYSREPGTKRTPEEIADFHARLDEARKMPRVEDPDCPYPTLEELSEFRPVATTTREERKQIAIEGAMRRSNAYKKLHAKDTAPEYATQGGGI
jgi:hypothetical protein